MRIFQIRLWVLGAMGLLLLAPASYFLLTLFVRVVSNVHAPYHALAPAVLGWGSDLFDFHKASLVLYGPLFALVLNWCGDVEFLRSKRLGFTIRLHTRGHWINTAVGMQGLLLFLLMVTYLLIEAIRY